MERLKSVLADKILDLSSGNGDEVKQKLEKIQGFRDFANALKSLMVKYPLIEDELIAMVEDGDYDTKAAASRVDNVIRLADSDSSVVIEPVRAEGDTSVQDQAEIVDPDSIPMEIYTGVEDSARKPDVPADLEFAHRPDIDSTQNDYIELTTSEIVDTSYDIDADSEPDTITEGVVGIQDESDAYARAVKTEEESSIDKEEAAAKRKIMFRRILQVSVIILIVVALIFVIKFVMVHWQAILIAVGVLVVLGILFFVYKRKRR